MDKVKTLLKCKQNPQEQLRDWQRRLRQQYRNNERQIRDFQREEKKVDKAMKEAAKRNDLVSAKALAKTIVMAVNRLQEIKAQRNSISMHLGESVANAQTVGHISKSAEVMKLVNDITKAPSMAPIVLMMLKFSKEMTKAGVIEETVPESIDSALDWEDIEDETEKAVNKVLSEIAAETAAQLPEAVRKERNKLPAQEASTSLKEEAIAEGGDEYEELEVLRAKLAKVRS